MSSWQTRPTMRSRSGSRMSPPSMIADDGDAVDRAAVLLDDDDVLRHVDETARQVARVGRLERRVGETLAGAVGRDEVLQHREAFAEVRGDRRLDDLARGLGHQAAHAGELADLLLGASGAGVGHHVDRVELRPTWSDFFISRNISSEMFSVVAVPDVDDLVVALARGDDAGVALALDLEDLLAGAGRGSPPSSAGITMSSTPIEMPAWVA